jgi:hypothetical protein
MNTDSARKYEEASDQQRRSDHFKMSQSSLNSNKLGSGDSDKRSASSGSQGNKVTVKKCKMGRNKLKREVA